MTEQSARLWLARTDGEGPEQRCALRVQHGARALTCSSLRGRKVLH